MNRLILAAALAVIPASAQTTMHGLDCKLVIQYDPTNPERIALTVPDKAKGCDTRSIKRVLGYLMFRFQD